MAMESRERLRIALNHQEPDRVPIDLGGTCTTIELPAYENLLKYLGITGRAKAFNRCHTEPDESVLRRFDVDTRYVRLGAPDSIQASPQDGRIIDDWGVTWYKAPSSYYYEIASAPLRDATVHDLAAYRWPDVNDPGRTRGLKEKVESLYYNTNCAIVADCIGFGVFEQAWVLRGFETFLTDLIVNSSFATTLMEYVAEVQMALWDRYLDIVGKYVQVVVVLDDLGTEGGLIVSPDVYRRLIKPVQKKVWSYIKSKTNACLFLHSCGAIAPLIPDFIELGVDILNPIQVSARGMDTKFLKSRFGQQLVFWGGGCDTQRVLPQGTPFEVREEVYQRIRDLSPGGGFVFCPVHNIQPDVPPENIVTLFDAARIFGVYQQGNFQKDSRKVKTS